MIQFDEEKVTKAVERLAPPGTGQQVALDDIADAMEEANDNCCGCGWVAVMAGILRGEQHEIVNKNG